MSRPPSGPQSEWSNQMLENLVVGLIVGLLLAAVARLPKLVRARWQRAACGNTINACSKATGIL